MGSVYTAIHTSIKRVVAVQVLDRGLTDKARKLFQQEVQSAAKLLHPNIVTAYDAGNDAGWYFVVTECIDWPNLDDVVRSKGPLPISLACEVVRQVALGLERAFERGMVHRDINPANLLVQESAGIHAALSIQVKIRNFGLARLRPVDQSVFRAPCYWSPELSRSMDSVDVRSDLYSLGCTFYFLLTGKDPFPIGPVFGKLLRHGSEEPVPVEEHGPEVPLPVAQIVRRLMGKDPAARFQTPAALAEALAPYSKEGPGSSLGER
jgi:serine/threonine-protein kinase